MMPIKCSSTGKSEAKRSQLTRMTEYSTCLKVLPDSACKKDYQRTQPVKIAQLLKQAEMTKSAHKDSVRKLMQPERLGKSATKTGNKKNETRRLVQPGKSVRRILSFNEPNAMDKCKIKDSASKFVDVYRKSIAKPVRSSILPPNTIAEKHIQKCSSQANSYSRIAEMSQKRGSICNEASVKKDISSTSESSDINVNSTEPQNSKSIRRELKSVNDTNDTQRFKIPNNIQRSKIPNVPKVIIARDEDLPQVITSSEDKNENSEVCTGGMELGGSVQNLCKDLQSMMSITRENHVKTEDGSSNMIYIERDKFISLRRSLESLMRIVSSILMSNDEATRLPNNELQKEYKTTVDREVQVDISPEEQLETIKNIPSVELELLLENDEDNKENEDLGMLRLSDSTTNLSFLELENQLNIIHAEPTPGKTNRLKTPLIKRSTKKSFREYMALKSSISFLETPDGPRFKSLCRIDNLDKPALNRTSISKKLLDTILSLNSESPDSDS